MWIRERLKLEEIERVRRRDKEKETNIGDRGNLKTGTVGYV